MHRGVILFNTPTSKQTPKIPPRLGLITANQPLNYCVIFSEMKIMIPLITLLFLALVEACRSTFKLQVNVALFRILIISLFKLSTHFRPMFSFIPRTHRKNKRVSAVFKGCRKRKWFTKQQFCFSVTILFFVFPLNILKKPTLTLDEIISRLLHLNEICDFIVLAQVSF